MLFEYFQLSKSCYIRVCRKKEKKWTIVAAPLEAPGNCLTTLRFPRTPLAIPSLLSCLRSRRKNSFSATVPLFMEIRKFQSDLLFSFLNIFRRDITDTIRSTVLLNFIGSPKSPVWWKTLLMCTQKKCVMQFFMAFPLAFIIYNRQSWTI